MGKSIDESQRDAAPLLLIEQPKAAAQRPRFGPRVEAIDHVGLDGFVAKAGIVR